MKFGRELASQMVQEWQDAYMDYNYLKTLLKDVLRFRQKNALSSEAMSRTGSLQRRVSMYRAFSGLTSRYTTFKGSPRARKNEDEVILVSAVQQEGSESCYQTMFLRSAEEGGEYELVFFRGLDNEFNKVVKFYKEKVREVKMEAEELSKQMDALIALRISAPATVIATLNGTKQGGLHMDVIQELEIGTFGCENKLDNEDKKDENGFRASFITSFGSCKNQCGTRIPRKDELRKAEEKLRNAFIEFYRKLRLLKSYCFLNMLALSKILKKYDKITSRKASKSYLEMVDNSYLGSSDEVNRLIEKLEATFIKHFSNGNRRKGMNSLKPQAKKERHRITFFLGLFTWLLNSTGSGYYCRYTWEKSS
ncbi:Phosphate transporter PHO13 [Abeliophyllum distichum]|uniref:Phosphate transporter PHO13 n=1 Tax=Abeliophyllum distichum TaxID=126358 RepID=A0ABD1V413_9LAMI